MLSLSQCICAVGGGCHDVSSIPSLIAPSWHRVFDDRRSSASSAVTRRRGDSRSSRHSWRAMIGRCASFGESAERWISLVGGGGHTSGASGHISSADAVTARVGYCRSRRHCGGRLRTGAWDVYTQQHHRRVENVVESRFIAVAECFAQLSVHCWLQLCVIDIRITSDARHRELRYRRTVPASTQTSSNTGYDGI